MKNISLEIQIEIDYYIYSELERKFYKTFPFMKNNPNLRSPIDSNFRIEMADKIYRAFFFHPSTFSII